MAIPGCAIGTVPTVEHTGKHVLTQPVLTSRGMRGIHRSLIAGVRAMLSSRSEGSALVETAVTLPLILFLMTGIFAFSIALYQKMELEEAVSTGGRVMAVDRGDADPCTTTTNAILAATPSLLHSSLTITYALNGTTTPLVAGTPEGTACNGVTLTPGANAVVTAKYPCTLGIYGGSIVTCTMTSQVTEVIQ